MDKVVIDLYKKKLYTDETFKKFVRVGWITPEHTGKDYEPQVK
ncbi:MAG: XkdX family protein [Staphylococcus warneri]|nr:XkdX family protein [Staphylococcus warneri]